MEERGISRGTLLKRAGAGAALVWAGPMITSASAARLPRHWCGKTGPNPSSGVCNDGVPAPFGVGGCEVNGNPCEGQCLCHNSDEHFCTCLNRTATKKPEGVCFCHEPSSCSCVTTWPCTKQRQCPENWACAASCCSVDASEKFCHPPCLEACRPNPGVAAASVRGTSAPARA
jgi:hypothetical protein